MTSKPFGKGTTHFAEKQLSLTLSADNQIIHPSRLFVLNRQFPNGWSTIEEVPYFYRDWDEESSMILSDLDSEYERVRAGVRKIHGSEGFEYMLNYLDLERFSWNSNPSNVTETFTQSTTLREMNTPVIYAGGSYVLDPQHRFFQDDFEFGLKIVSWLGERLGIDAPRIREVYNWGLGYREFFRGTKRIPSIISHLESTPDSYGLKVL